MDKRTLLAALLMALVIVVTPRLFSSKSTPTRADSTTAKPAVQATNQTPAQPSQPIARAAPSPPQQAIAARSASVAATLHSSRAAFALLNPGATIGDVT